jgi:hypothetical protein
MTACVVSFVSISLPPITIGIEIRSRSICARRTRSSSRSGVPGAYEWTGSLAGLGGLKIPGALTARL